MHTTDKTGMHTEPDTHDAGGKNQTAQEPGGTQKPRTPDGRTPARDAQADRGKDPKKGFDREVGAFDEPDAQDDDALPGRAGGGLAGG